MEAHGLPSPVPVAGIVECWIEMDNSDPEWIYGNNLKLTETVTEQIIEIEELREEKLAKRNAEQI